MKERSLLWMLCDYVVLFLAGQQFTLVESKRNSYRGYTINTHHGRLDEDIFGRHSSLGLLNSAVIVLINKIKVRLWPC